MRPRHPLICLIAILLVAGLISPVAAAQTASIQGIVFLDKGLDGLMSDRDTGLPGADVQLMRRDNGSEQPVANQRTGADGAFLFSNLAAGDYYLKVLLPDEHVPGPYAAKGSQLIPSSTADSLTPGFYLAEGEQRQDLLLAAMPRKQGSFVRATAFGDSDLNGGRFSNEPLLRDVQLELLFELGGVFYPVGSARTNREGIGTIDNVAPGTYILAATMPGDYVIGPIGKKLNPFYNTILPADDNYGRSAPFQLPARGSMGMGVGGAITGQGGGQLWLDANMDGKLDPDEKGLAGIQVSLEHLSMGVKRSMVTDQAGQFSFHKLQPGSYRLSVELPEAYMFTLPGGDSILSSSLARVDSATVSVLAEHQADFGLVGVIPNTSLEILAFHDRNVNGIREADEPAFAGAELTVLVADKVIASAQSDAQGRALIPLLRGGDMTLQLSLPDGQIFSVSGGEGGNAFFDLRAKDGITLPYTQPHGVAAQLLAGVTLPAQISGSLFEDKNNNAILDSDEGPMPGFVVQVMDDKGQMIEATTSDEQGRYLSPALIPGSYKLRVLLKSPYIFSGSPAQAADRMNHIIMQTPDWGESGLMTLQAGQTREQVDAALFRSGVIQGQVLLGDHHDAFGGQQGGLQGVEVTLLDEDGQEVSEYTIATTDGQGQFLLKGALPGTYSLRYQLPEGAAFSRPLLEETQLQSAPFDVKASDQLQAPTLFAVKTGSFSGKAYLDMNVNGSQDEPDQPLSGVMLELVSEIAANSREGLSGDDGSFAIEGLRPGSYKLRAVLPDGKLISADANSPLSPAISSTAEADISLGMGQQMTDQAIAAVNPHSLAGQLYFDNNLNRSWDQDEPGYGEQEIRLRHELSQVEFKAVSDSQGGYSIPLLFPGRYKLSMTLPEGFELYAPEDASRQGRLFEHSLRLVSADASTQWHLGLVQFGSLAGQLWDLGGSQDNLEGIAISLRQASGTQPLQETLSDSQGAYHFDQLYPGDYVLSVQLPDSYRFARQIDSQRTRFSLITSDGSPVTGSQGQSNPFPLLMAEHKQGQDIGMGTLGQLGDFAWLDLDRDGMQDAGEPGVPGIQIRIYQHDQLAQETITDAYGRYLFREVYPGSYRMEVSLPPELMATRQQQEFPLVASVLPEGHGPLISVEGISVPSGSRNLNADLGFALVKDEQWPASMQSLPKKDWTPLVPVVPKRSR